MEENGEIAVKRSTLSASRCKTDESLVFTCLQEITLAPVRKIHTLNLFLISEAKVIYGVFE